MAEQATEVEGQRSGQSVEVLQRDLAASQEMVKSLTEKGERLEGRLNQVLEHLMTPEYRAYLQQQDGEGGEGEPKPKAVREVPGAEGEEDLEVLTQTQLTGHILGQVKEMFESGLGELKEGLKKTDEKISVGELRGSLEMAKLRDPLMRDFLEDPKEGESNRKRFFEVLRRLDGTPEEAFRMIRLEDEDLERRKQADSQQAEEADLDLLSQRPEAITELGEGKAPASNEEAFDLAWKAAGLEGRESL